MNELHTIRQTFFDVLAALGLPLAVSNRSVTFDLNVDEQKQQFGDLNSNAAMILAKQLNRSPRDLAQQIVAAFSHPHVTKIEIAGPGFLNFFLSSQAYKNILSDLVTRQEAFFKLDASQPRISYNIEFVSANPTGPLHLGHGRGGIIGDVLSNIVDFIGHSVVKEFYINDAGSQIGKLGLSLKVRCQQASGIDVQLPEEGYAGSYLVDLAQTCLKEYGVGVLKETDAFFQAYAMEHMLAMIKETLALYGIHFDTWFSEKELHTDGSISRTIDILQERGYLFLEEGALWFRSTAFGDDKDRVVRKSSGEYTYIAADAAYLKNKADRGFDQLIMILGHDHHGYVLRLQGLRQALGIEKTKLDIILYQLVKMKLEGEQVRMSKRAGNIVTLSDVIETVGTDVARFFYLNRKADAQLEFDLDLALKKTEENPVYYVQYAYVRTQSILNKAATHEPLQNVGIEDRASISENEYILIKKIASLKILLEHISTNYQTHLLTYYVLELSHAFHRYYAEHRVIDLENIPQSRARLLLIKTVRNTLQTVLQLLGISRPVSM